MLPSTMVKPIIETMYDDGMNTMVPLVIGAPGIGKTQGIAEVAEEKGVKCVSFILSNTVPSEVSGIRMPDTESKTLEVFDDSRMSSLEDGDILFFDEILEAPPALWSACLTLIQDRTMASGRKLPNVFICAASNPVASPGIIPASVRDRFQIIELYFDKSGWRQYFYDKHGVDPFQILSKIQGDSDQYNILTPRRVEKLYTWLKNGKQEGESWENKKRIISSMFDSAITDCLLKMAKHIPTPQQQIKAALDQSNLDINTSAIEYWSLENIMAYLAGLPEWEEIQAVLSSVTFEEHDEEEVVF